MPKNLLSFFSTNFLLSAFISDTIVNMIVNQEINQNGAIASSILAVFMIVVIVYSRKLFKDNQALLKGVAIVIGALFLLGVLAFVLSLLDLGSYTLIVNLVVSIVLTYLVNKSTTAQLSK